MATTRFDKLRVHVLAVGLKGYVFLMNIIESGLVPAQVTSYNQQYDRSEAFDRILQLCSAFNVPFSEEKYPSWEMMSNADLVFVVGWQYLISHYGLPLVVFHDSLLPLYRGFSPTVTALIVGETKIGVTAFIPAENIDAGPILAQSSFQIGRPARIGDVLTQQAKLMATLAVDLTQRKLGGELLGIVQDEAQATYSIWRDASDYNIDWSWDAHRIERFVYAVGAPYGGARSSLSGQAVVIEECEALNVDLSFAIRQPGKIWSITDQCPTVVCGTGMLKIISMSSPDGERIFAERLRTGFR